MNKYTYTTAVALMSSLLTLIVTSAAFFVFIVLPFNKAAVEGGHAYWRITNAATGATQFTWTGEEEGNLFDEIEKPLVAPSTSK
jgi:hypothetical protein